MRTFHFVLTALAAVMFASTAHAEIPKDISPLKEGELSQLCGGFILANGGALNVGIDNQISVGGVLVADATFNANGSTVTTSSTGAVHIQGVGGSTDITQISATGQTIIVNTASNTSLNQVRTITIDMNSVAHQALVNMHNFSLVQAQAIASFKHGLH
jgi:hypothetical protein